MSKRKQQKTKQQPHVPKGHNILHLSYEITDEPLHDSAHEALPELLKADIERLYYLSKDHPTQAIAELLPLRERYPEIPRLDNFLSIAYSRDGQIEKAREVVEQSYRTHPEYFFARLNYAELCLNNDQLDQIPQIFNNKFDLSLLFPERKRFHESEFGGFAGIMGVYFYKKGDNAQAEQYYQLLKRSVPDHPYTKRLGQLLAAPAIRDALKKILEQH